MKTKTRKPEANVNAYILQTTAPADQDGVFSLWTDEMKQIAQGANSIEEMIMLAFDFGVCVALNNTNK